MKLEITETGVYDQDGEELEVGTELTVDSETVPAWLVNKCRIISEKSKKADTAVTNEGEGEGKDAASPAASQKK